MRSLPLLALLACNPDPTAEVRQGVTYRDGLEPGEPNSGERGSIRIAEVFWSGSVDNDGNWDPTDVFVELRNESTRPVNVGGWQLVLEGAKELTLVIPSSDLELPVGAHLFLAAKDTGCFPEPDWVVPGLAFSYGDPFRLTLLDVDDRLIEPVGNDEALPFAGGYDGVQSRSMERAELMFGADGSFPHIWHYYTETPVEVPNNDRIAESCRDRTLASPGRANSPDYSGAFATGSLE